MELRLVGNTEPAILLGDGPEEGTSRVFVLAGAERTVASSDLYDPDERERGDNVDPANGTSTTSGNRLY